MRANGEAFCFSTRPTWDSVSTRESCLAYTVPGKILRFSTKTGEGLASLEETVTELFFEGVFDNRNEVLSVNARHKEVLREAIESLRNVQASVAAGMPEDFFSID